jgi:quercetin dioxygenase-like cupin family protein
MPEKENENKPYQLAASIQIQSGSVVSKTLVNKSAGTLTLFAFDEGQSLSEHTAPFDAFVEILEGEAEITLGGKPYLLKSGDVLLMPANVPHGLKAVTAYKMLLTMIKA